jgi:hypothetical protein
MDQSLVPPTMPACADSQPDFVHSFGLDVPEETNKELEQEQSKQNSLSKMFQKDMRNKI